MLQSDDLRKDAWEADIVVSKQRTSRISNDMTGRDVVQVWFKNRRAKDRKQKRETDSKDGTNQKITASDESDYDVSDDECTKPKKQRVSVSSESKTDSNIA